MENTKYIYEVTGEREMLMGTGETMEILAHIGRQIQIIHERMKKQNPRAAEAFRAAIVAMVLDPTCPIWTSSAVTGGVGVDCFVMQDKKRGGVQTMRSLSKQPGEGWKVTEIQNELEPLQRAVGGHLESVSLWADACILCNEEGRIKGMPYNTTICGVSFVGPILIVGTAGEDFSDLTEQQEHALRAMGVVV